MHEEVWNRCLKIIKDNVPSISYRTWFEPIIPLKLESNILTIQVPSPFFYEYLEEQYIDILRKVLRKELGYEAKLEYSVVMENNGYASSKPYTVKLPARNQKELKNKPVSVPIDAEGTTIKNPFIIPGLKKLNIDPMLNPENSFTNFVEGDCNRLARSAGYAVANNPGGTAFNPLLIYGESGLGKTHLAQAIGIQVKEKFQEKTVLYNHLHQSGKQLILTSDKPPVELQGLEQRLLSRFKWGLAADLQVPDFETRIAILRQKTYKDGIDMPADVIEYIATHITDNIRELEGALISLLAQSTLNKKEITLDLAKDMIDKLIKNTKREISIDYIQKVVCNYFNIPIEQIQSKTRKREIVQARQVAMFFSKNLTKASLATIGSQIGGKDHATVLHACKTVNNLIETDKRFRIQIDEIEKKLKI